MQRWEQRCQGRKCYVNDFHINVYDCYGLKYAYISMLLSNINILEDLACILSKNPSLVV